MVVVIVAFLLFSGMGAVVAAPGSSATHATRSVLGKGSGRGLILSSTQVRSGRAIPQATGSIGSVISTLDLSTNRLYTGPKVLGVQPSFGPAIPIYDPVNGNFYIRGSDDGDISVVNASTFADVANILSPVTNQGSPAVPSIAVDNATGYLYATNAGYDNVSILDPTTETVSGTFAAGAEPYGIAFDWMNHDLYVADFGGANVAVVSTASNSTVTYIPVGTEPASIVFDPSVDRLFVANYGSANVSVIDPGTQSVSATVAVGTRPMAVALDSVDGDVDVLNGLAAASSVSTFPAAAPPTSTTPVSVAAYAASFAYDAASDRLFVAGESGSLTVLQQPGNTVASTLSIGSDSEWDATAYDAKDGYVFVTALDGGPNIAGNITVIDGMTDHSVANDTTNGFPIGVAVDPGTGDAYVVNMGSSVLEPNVTALGESSGLPIASIPLWVVPTGLTYDSAQGEVLAVDSAGDDVYAVNTTTGHTVAVETGGPVPTSPAVPAGIAYDGANGETYTTDETQAAVSVFGPSHTLVTTISVGEEPDALAYDNASDLLFVGDAYTGKVAIIDTSTNSVLPASLPVKPYDILSGVVYDPHNNEVYVADQDGDNVTVWGAENHTEVRSVPVGSSPRSIVFDPENDTVFVANVQSGNVSVINDSTNRVVESITSEVGAYILAYDGASNAVYNAYYDANEVTAFNASTYAPLSGSPLEFGEGGGYYVEGLVYDPANGLMYAADSTGDALNAIGPVTPPTGYTVTFVETGLPQGTGWAVTLNGTERSSSTPTIQFSDERGSLPFTVAPVEGYVANVTSGTVVVTNGPRTVDIGFALVETPVSFVETGLPLPTLWNVTLNGSVNQSTTDTIGFLVPPNDYPFTVGPVAGFVANVTSGEVVVNTEPVVVHIRFTAVTTLYPVTFVESGLPVGTSWSVTYHGATNASTSSSIGFVDPNGTWPFSVGSVSGYSAAPASGSVTVNGAPAQQGIRFTAGVALLTVDLTVIPSKIRLGNSTVLTATVSGGVPPVSYDYSGLPTGCATQNSSSWTCTPSETGNFSVVVTVTDSKGTTAHATATLNVSTVSGTPPSNGAPSSSGLTPIELGGILAAVVAGVALFLFLIVSRRRRRAPPSPSTSTNPPGNDPPR